MENLNIIKKNIGRNIQVQRTCLGMSVTDLQEATNISTSMIYDIERGIKFPSIESLILLSNALNCSADYILTGQKTHDMNLEDLTLMNKIKTLPIRDQEEIRCMISLKDELIEKYKNS